MKKDVFVLVGAGQPHSFMGRNKNGKYQGLVPSKYNGLKAQLHLAQGNTLGSMNHPTHLAP